MKPVTSPFTHGPSGPFHGAQRMEASRLGQPPCWWHHLNGHLWVNKIWFAWVSTVSQCFQSGNSELRFWLSEYVNWTAPPKNGFCNLMEKNILKKLPNRYELVESKRSAKWNCFVYLLMGWVKTCHGPLVFDFLKHDFNASGLRVFPATDLDFSGACAQEMAAKPLKYMPSLG